MSAPALVGGNLAATLEVLAHDRGWLERPLLRCGEGQYSFGEVLDRAARLATLLGERGVRPGDRVLVAAADSVGLATAFLGTLRMGAVAVTVNPALTATDHATLLADAGPALVVADEAVAARFSAAPRVVVTDDITRAIADLAPSVAAPLGTDEPAYVQYTSGTTGRPKGAVHRHADPLTYFDAVADAVYGLGPDDVVFCVSKMFFAYGLPSSLLHPMLAGCSAVLERERPTPALARARCAEHGVTVLLSVPTFFAALVDEGHAEDLRSVRLAISGGEPLRPLLRQSVEAFLGCPILNHLGSTEIGHGYVSDLVADRRDGTAGRALPPYQVEVRDSSGTAVPPGTEGQVWVTGPTLMLGYLGQPEQTAAALVDGWLRSGDLGVLDEDGFLTLAGRADDIEIVSGYKIWPGEVESALGRHEAVSAVAVVGQVDEDRGSVLHAVVVCRAGVEGDQALVDELVAVARDALAPFKVPRRYTFVDELPRTATGKLQRFRLRAEAPALTAGATTFARRADWSTAPSGAGAGGGEP